MAVDLSIPWELQNTPGARAWASVCWAPEISLVCVTARSGTGNRVMTSPDGVNWTLRASADDTKAWNSVCWSPSLGIFCAVESSFGSASVMTSPDGISWTLRSTPADKSWRAVCWSPDLGIFCAVGSRGTGNRVMTSPDGINWTLRASIADVTWYYICWSPELNMFCAAAQSSDFVMTSPDGINWTSRPIPPAYYPIDVIWSPELSLFCLTAYRTGVGYRSVVSYNGIDWILGDVLASSISKVCWSSQVGIFVATRGSNSDKIWISPDGLGWIEGQAAAIKQWSPLCWAPGLSMFIAASSTDTVEQIMTWMPLEMAESVFWTNEINALIG